MENSFLHQVIEGDSMAASIQSTLFVQAACQLGEGPFWFSERLWWVDIDQGCLHSVDRDGVDQTNEVMGEKVGSVVPIDGNRFVLALERGIAFLDLAQKTIEHSARHDTPSPKSRFNDGKCDPVGRFVVGTLCTDGARGSSALYSFRKGGAMRRILSDVSVSNGLAWTADGQTMYYIDSPTFEVAAFAYDCTTGQLGKRTVVIRVPESYGVPDGMDVDVDGNLWIAHWGGASVRCWSPFTGKCLAVVKLPCSQATSCCFGGPNLDRLFVTSARTGFTEEDLRLQPFAGSLFVCSPGTSGFSTRIYHP